MHPAAHSNGLPRHEVPAAMRWATHQPSLAGSHRRRVPPFSTQIVTLFILALPIASIAWTVTHEEVFREPREYCEKQSKSASLIWRRKFFYPLHLRILFQSLRRRHLPGSHPLPTPLSRLARLHGLDVRAGLDREPLHAVFASLRLDLRHEHIEIKSKDLDLQSKERQIQGGRAA